MAKNIKIIRKTTDWEIKIDDRIGEIKSFIHANGDKFSYSKISDLTQPLNKQK